MASLSLVRWLRAVSVIPGGSVPSQQNLGLFMIVRINHRSASALCVHCIMPVARCAGASEQRLSPLCRMHKSKLRGVLCQCLYSGFPALRRA